MQALPAAKSLEPGQVHIDFAHHSETRAPLRIVVVDSSQVSDNQDKHHPLLTPGIYTHYKNGKLYKLHGLVLLDDGAWAAWYTGLYGLGPQALGPSWLRPLHSEAGEKSAGWLDTPGSEAAQRFTLVQRLYAA